MGSAATDSTTFSGGEKLCTTCSSCASRSLRACCSRDSSSSRSPPRCAHLGLSPCPCHPRPIHSPALLSATRPDPLVVLLQRFKSGMVALRNFQRSPKGQTGRRAALAALWLAPKPFPTLELSQSLSLLT
ncbi:hypothetical protein MPH_04468 [Macrophomina phaseolina MS6]|uniref:Uncharacterized protein n=1 Tax=Macrophomina phaseolina (strain MS6) TaxID=1126212 RepID=K2RU04_MACPH|nr:hypothetical protein MPH_04468 [Macrophomina phaseolina MS6]